MHFKVIETTVETPRNVAPQAPIVVGLLPGKYHGLSVIFSEKELCNLSPSLLLLNN